MPLFNVIVLYGDASPVVVSFCDFSDHMSEGGKKDVTYIAVTLQQKVNEFDTEG